MSIGQCHKCDAIYDTDSPIDSYIFVDHKLECVNCYESAFKEFARKAPIDRIYNNVKRRHLRCVTQLHGVYELDVRKTFNDALHELIKSVKDGNHENAK